MAGSLKKKHIVKTATPSEISRRIIFTDSLSYLCAACTGWSDVVTFFTDYSKL
jgi:hypothetical protein